MAHTPRSFVAAAARTATIVAATWASLSATSLAHSTELELPLQIKAHRFEPTELHIPANTRVKLLVHNTDNTAEEFESHALNREKLIAAGAKTTIYIGPLKPGRYEFFGEFNPNSAKGAVVVE
jgi:plastocyanin